MTITKEDMQKIWTDVQANHARLDSCKRHDFALIPQTVKATLPDGHSHTITATLRNRYRCRHCRGEINAVAYLWFERGRKMA